MVRILSKGDKGDKTITEVCREHGISQPTFYNWRRRFRGQVEPVVMWFLIGIPF